MRLCRCNIYFILSALFALLESAAILCLPLVDLEGNATQRVGAYILAGGFWLSIICTLVFTILCSRDRKRLVRSDHQKVSLNRSVPGIVSFFSNIKGTIADIVLFVAVISVVIIVCTNVKNEWIILSNVSLLVLSFNMHCLLNGKNYRYIDALQKNKKEHDQK